jgi:hypothetical protein
MNIVEPLGNPATGETQITLNDNKPRTLCFDLDALYLLEEISGFSLAQLYLKSRSGLSLNLLQFFVYAGCYRDVVARHELWSVSQARTLLTMKGQLKIWNRALWAFNHSVTNVIGDDEPGETPAALPETPNRGDTTSR